MFILVDFSDLLAPSLLHLFFFFNDTATTEIYTLSLHDALPIRSTAPATSGVVSPSGFGVRPYTANFRDEDPALRQRIVPPATVTPPSRSTRAPPAYLPGARGYRTRGARAWPRSAQAARPPAPPAAKRAAPPPRRGGSGSSRS